MSDVRALVLENGALSVRSDRPAPTCGTGELLVRVLAVGICGTDVTLASGRRPVPREPWVLGHEAVGEVVEVGSGVTGWSVGDRAVLEPNVVDLTCPACRAGRTSACGHRSSSGVLTEPGFMQELVNHPAEFCFKADADARIEDLVCTEPMTVAAAAIRRSGIGPEGRALVLGAGAQGLFATQLLRAQGVIPMITDLDDGRVALAVHNGAVAMADDAGGFTHVYDTTGAPAALSAALPRLAPGAVVTVVGESSKPFQLSTQDVVQHQLTIIGSFIYDHPVDFTRTLSLIHDRKVAPHALLQDPMSLDDAVTGLLGNHAQGKPWIRMIDLPEAEQHRTGESLGTPAARHGRSIGIPDHNDDAYHHGKNKSKRSDESSVVKEQR